MKITNTKNTKKAYLNFEMFKTSKHATWNNRRRYS